MASGPATTAAVVTAVGMRKRLRMSGTTTEAAIAATAPARTAGRAAGLVTRRRFDLPNTAREYRSAPATERIECARLGAQ